MKTIFTLILLFFLISCKSKYTYVEQVREADLIGSGFSYKDKEPVIIEAENNNEAYKQAYTKYCISKKVAKDMKEAYNYNTSPISFKILNDKQEDISKRINFIAKDSIEREIDKSIGDLKTNIKESNAKQKEIAKKSEECPVKILSSRPVEKEYSNYKDIHLS